MKQLFYIAFILIGFNVHAQKDSTKLLLKGNENFENRSYSLALQNFGELINKSTDIQRKMGYCYWKTNQLPQAERMYSKVINSGDYNQDELYEYTRVLLEVEAYEEFEKQMDLYVKKKPDEIRSKLYLKYKGSYKELQKNDSTFRLVSVNANSGHQDFAATYYGDQIVYVSSKAPSSPIRRRYNANLLPYLDLYVATVFKDKFVNVKSFGKGLNTKFHEGPAAFSADNSTIYFSRNDKKRNADVFRFR